MFFGIGSTAAALLVWGTFYVYTVASIMVFAAAVPAMFAIVYGTSGLRTGAIEAHGATPDLSTRSVGAILLALLLFFQFGNEWSVASWLSTLPDPAAGDQPGDLAAAAGTLLGGPGHRPRNRDLDPPPPPSRASAAGLGIYRGLRMHCAQVHGDEIRSGKRDPVRCGGFRLYLSAGRGKDRETVPVLPAGVLQRHLLVRAAGGHAGAVDAGYMADVHGIGIVMGLPLVETLAVFVLVLLIWLEARITRAEPRTAAALVFLLVSALPGANTQLGTRIQRLLGSTQAARSATWGIQITNARTGTVAYQFNPDRLLVPASGVKLFTTALALARLGPDYRYSRGCSLRRRPMARA